MKRASLAAAGIAAMLGAGAYVAWASSPDAWAALQSEAEAACMAASGLDEPGIVAPTTNFESHVFVVVDGKWPASSALSGEAAHWVCLYDKEQQAAEAREPGFP